MLDAGVVYLGISGKNRGFREKGENNIKGNEDGL
jgi:hypothetical protein